MREVIVDLKPAIDWFNAITCGIIIGWWMRALYDWMRARSVRPTVRAFVVEKYDEAPVPTTAEARDQATDGLDHGDDEATDRDK